MTALRNCQALVTHLHAIKFEVSCHLSYICCILASFGWPGKEFPCLEVAPLVVQHSCMSGFCAGHDMNCCKPCTGSSSCPMMSCWRSWRRQRSLATCSPLSRSVLRLSRSSCLLMMAKSLAWFLLKVSKPGSPAASQCHQYLPCCTVNGFTCKALSRHNIFNFST